jgi:hypothetical protein
MRFVLLLVLMVTFLGCNPTGRLNDKIEQFAKDQNINQEEYFLLIDSASSIPTFSTSDSSANDTALRKYIDNYLKATNTSATVWKPETKVRSFNISVYLENSASMDGYVKGVTDFETAIYNMLGDIKISDFVDSLNLFYINNSIPYSKVNALAPDIEDFIEKLEPSIFKQRGGNRSTSDIKNIIQMVLNEVDSSNVAILISDFVFSPSSSKNATEDINKQSIGIKIDIADKLKIMNLSVAILQMNSRFDGMYYDMNNRPRQYFGNRPYFIWFIGDNEQIKHIINSGLLRSMRGGYTNLYVLHSNQSSISPEYKIKISPRVGQFKLERGATQISGANANGKDFMFQVMVNLSELDFGSSYLTNASNYRINGTGYSLEVAELTDNREFTHLMTVTTNNFIPEPITIELLANTPNWAEQYSTLDDTNTAPDSDQAGKTFGLLQLIEGVHDAFYPATSSRSILSITIPIKQ